MRLFSYKLSTPTDSFQVTLKTSAHYCLVRGLSLSWRSLFSGLWSGYPSQPQELHHYPLGLHWRGGEDMSGSPHHLSSILCLTSNLPMITSRSMIGTCEILDMWLYSFFLCYFNTAILNWLQSSSPIIMTQSRNSLWFQDKVLSCRPSWPPAPRLLLFTPSCQTSRQLPEWAWLANYWMWQDLS